MLEFLISFLYVLRLSTSLIALMESSFLCFFNEAGDFHILLLQSKSNALLFILLHCIVELGATLGVRCVSQFFLA